jgi:hypothetical protein
MNTQMGERYKCSDSNCGCEIEVTNPSRMQQGSSYGRSSMNAGSSEQRIGGSATGETGVGSLRNAEAGGISTPGDFGSQGATGEGVFGTSGGNQRSTMSGRLGSATGSSLESAPSISNTSSIETGSSSEANFSCCCGQPMRKTQSSRAASARV